MYSKLTQKRVLRNLICLFTIALLLLQVQDVYADSSPSNENQGQQSSSLQNGDLSTSPNTAERRVIVTFKDKVDEALIHGKIKHKLKHIASVSTILSSDEIDKLKHDPEIKAVEDDVQVKVAEQTMDWGTTVVQAAYSWNNGYTGAGVKVAVLDSGISLNHEDLTVAGGVSMVDYTTSYDDDNGHGTHVAGIIGAKNNDVGTVGVAPDASLYAVKVLDAHGTGYLSDVIDGIDWSIDNHMDIANLSLTTAVDSPALHDAVDQAYANGVLVVAAAGNAGTTDGTEDTIQYPAKYSSVISVGAVDQGNQRASFSSTGGELEVVAPGVGINSTGLNSSYVTMSGTSMSAAFATGELALIKQENPAMINDQLRALLDQHVLDLGQAGKDSVYGYGVINYNSTSGSLSLNQGSTDTVITDVYGEPNQNLLTAAGTGSHILVRDYYGGNTVDETSLWPSLVNAKSIAVGYNVSDSCYQRYVLYTNNTVQYTDCADHYGNGYSYDDTSNWPSLVNAKSIAYMYRNYYGTYEAYRYVLYNDNTVKYRKWTSYMGINGPTTDDTSFWPDLTNAKAIAFEPWFNQYVLYNNNTVISDDRDVTSNFPDLVNAKAIGANDISSYPSDIIKYYAAYLDVNPSIATNNTNQTIYKNSSPTTITLSGTVNDPDNDNVTISATIAGHTKTTTITNTSSSKPWSLQWDVNTDNVPVGNYSNITVTANDGLWGNASTTYTGTIVVDNVPNVPTTLSPGSSSSSSPSLVSGTTPTLRWTFSDPDVGDTQSAFDVRVYNSSGSTLLYDTGWVNSSVSSFTVPSGKLNRGTVYSWRVATRDSHNGSSASFAPLVYIKTNSLPTTSFTSYTDGQLLGDNILTLSWTYADAEGQPQASYRLQGSKDNWQTIGYDTGVISGAATSRTTTPLPDGTWSFKITVSDGLEWSAAATRNNLIVPNAYEPNDTSAQAFAINYNTAYTSVINSASDIDFFKYVAPESGVDQLTLNVPTDKNYDVYIYDANMKFLAAGLVNAAGGAENVIYKVSSGATYYIKIVGVNGDSSSSSYNLQVNKFSMETNTTYQYDANGNIISRTTSTN
ncbi:S8 family serine peptidase [Paenibacillus humicola]|uniref:S8 family serine peptidase n=1 Tax=Paenibacillus humicola TaxID=3110540 RepID=UPI00237BD0EC|nr:S8 family serine peptidase [Paenibacillus humicola]